MEGRVAEMRQERPAEVDAAEKASISGVRAAASEREREGRRKAKKKKRRERRRESVQTKKGEDRINEGEGEVSEGGGYKREGEGQSDVIDRRKTSRAERDVERRGGGGCTRQ